MAYIPGSSFIPKDTNATPKVLQRKRTFHVFGFAASTMLIVSLLAAIGVFLYEKYSDKQLEKARAELVKEQSLDLGSKMVEIAVFDRQLSLARQLLDNHIAPTRIFAELERMTKQSVQFTSFDYTYDPGYLAELDVKGGTNELTSVAVQKNEFSDQKLFSEFSVENIGLVLEDTTDPKVVISVTPSSDNRVDFSISGSINTKLIQYTGEDVPVPVADESLGEKDAAFEEITSTTDDVTTP
jgi:hypothetical protein